MASSTLNDYLLTGLLSARPATPAVVTGVPAFYWATDAGLSAFDGTAWFDVAPIAATTVTMPDAAYTLSAQESRAGRLLVGGPLTGPQDLVFPAKFGTLLVTNSTGFDLTLKKTGQPGVGLVDGDTVRVSSGATDVVADPSGTGTFTGGALTSALNEAKGADIASAATTDIGGATGNVVHVTGTTTITALGTVQAGTPRTVVFDGALTLTHHATSLILPTGADITTAASDVAMFRSEGSGNWRCVGYMRADGTALVGGGAVASVNGATGAVVLTIAGLTSTQTVTSSATVTPVATNDKVVVSAQAAAILFDNPSGTEAEGQGFVIALKDNGTARAITWGANYRAMGAALPTTTVLGKWMYIPVIYNATDDKWDVLAVSQQA